MADTEGQPRQGPDPCVSSDAEELILVDEADTEIGFLAKGPCHDGDGVRHRAFSLFVFSPAGEVLMQQRAADKRLWPGYWSNACCSHPRRGERVEEAVERRAAEELGLRLERLEFVYKFEYQAQYGDAGTEHELCWVFVAEARERPRPNANEIDAVRWLTPDELDRALAARPETFTPWCRGEWARLRDEFAGSLPGRETVR